MTGDVGASPFPHRSVPTVRVDSAAEERAYLAAYPAPGGPWEVVGQVLVSGGRPEDHLRLRSAGGEEAVVRFDVASFVGAGGELGEGAGAEAVDRVMERAGGFARENGPAHPGELPRFPVPSARYPGRVEVPLPILAVDDARRRGLYAPARSVVLGWPGGDPVGVGELPGFDPERWPPPRLGEWPPAGLAELGEARLRGIVARFGACWARLLDVFLGGEEDHYRQRADEAAESRGLLGVLEPAAMGGVYAGVSPRFWGWISSPFYSGE